VSVANETADLGGGFLFRAVSEANSEGFSLAVFVGGVIVVGDGDFVSLSYDGGFGGDMSLRGLLACRRGGEGQSTRCDT